MATFLLRFLVQVDRVFFIVLIIGGASFKRERGVTVRAVMLMTGAYLAYTFVMVQRFTKNLCHSLQIL